MTRSSRELTFEDLIHQLDMRTRAEDHKRFLAWWFKGAARDGFGPALAILLGRPQSQKVSVPALKKALFERVNQDLFEASKEAATDLSETLALLWPGGEDPLDVEALVSAMKIAAKSNRTGRVIAMLDSSCALARDLAIRIVTGRFKSPVTSDVVRMALAEAFDKPLPDVEQNLANADEALEAFSNWLFGEPFPAKLTQEGGFVSLPIIVPCKPEDANTFDQYIPLSRGTLYQMVTRPKGYRLHSLEGDVAADHAGPDLFPPLSTLLVFQPKKPDAPLILLDLLISKAKDLRRFSRQDRQQALQDLMAQMGPAAAMLAAPQAISTRIRKGFENPSVDRLLLLSSGAWGELRRPPHDLHLKILYAEGKVSRQGTFDGLVTLGATQPTREDSNQADLVPVGKAVIDALSTEDRAALESFIAENTTERFGPVRKLAATQETSLIARVACRAIEPAARRKAGLVLTGARVTEICNTSSAMRISTLDELATLALL